jgi:hypothetical protein
VVFAFLVLAVLAVLVGALGGWARTSPTEVRVVEPGAEVRAAPLLVRLDRAEATYEVSGRPAEAGRAYVVIEGALTLDHQESVDDETVINTFAADLLSTYDQFGNPSGRAEPSVQVAGDGSSLRGMGPDLAYDVLLVFEIDESAIPSMVTVTLLEHERRASFLDMSTVGWFDPEPFARLNLDVAPLPDQRPDEGDV